jgi:hypothetical protein
VRVSRPASSFSYALLRPGSLSFGHLDRSEGPAIALLFSSPNRAYLLRRRLRITFPLTIRLLRLANRLDIHQVLQPPRLQFVLSQVLNGIPVSCSILLLSAVPQAAIIVRAATIVIIESPTHSEYPVRSFR